MKNEDDKDIFEKIGEKFGVPAEGIRKEMELGIIEAYNNPDLEYRRAFRETFGDEIPSPEEVIYRIARDIKNQPDDKDSE